MKYINKVSPTRILLTLGIALDKHRILVAKMLGACLGLVLAFTYFDLIFITGSADYLYFNDDRLTTITGGNYFLREQWHFPLGDIKNYNIPEGSNIALTDSIPLVALLLKAFACIHPLTGIYIGWWILLCFALQGWMAVRVMQALGHANLAIVLLSALFALSYPAFIIHFGHAALMSHFFLLWAISLYIEGCKSGFPTRQHKKYVLLAALSLLVHIYLLAMVITLYVAYCGQAVISKRSSIWSNLAWLLGTSVLLLGLLLLVGVLRIGESFPASEGYGLFAMNLLDPWWPKWTGNKEIFSKWIPHRVNYEAYLGAGLILLAGISLGLGWKRFTRHILNHKLLCILVAGMVIFAVSNKVYFSKYLLFEYDTPFEYLCNQFRFSSRFLWPAGYLLLFMSIHALAVRTKTALTVGLLLCLSSIQHWDSRFANYDGYRNLPAIAESYRQEWVSLELLMQEHTEIAMFPYPSCNDFYAEYYSARIGYIASEHNLPINNGRLARGGKRCEDMQNTLNALQPTPQKLIILFKPYFILQDALLYGSDPHYIRETSTSFLISPRIAERADH